MQNGGIAAQALHDLDATLFKLFCTPVVNLFKRDATPIQLTTTDRAHPVTPEPLETGTPLDVYSIDAVFQINKKGDFYELKSATIDLIAG